MKDKLPLGKT